MVVECVTSVSALLMVIVDSDVVVSGYGSAVDAEASV